MLILAGFGAWSFCAVVCLMFFALVARRGQLEDQLAWELAHEVAPSQEPALAGLPAAALAAGAGLLPRGALDDQIASKASAGI